VRLRHLEFAREALKLEAALEVNELAAGFETNLLIEAILVLTLMPPTFAKIEWWSAVS
jgi:hypothetical protein